MESSDLVERDGALPEAAAPDGNKQIPCLAGVCRVATSLKCDSESEMCEFQFVYFEKTK